ncbi:MAG: hypothetical protein SO135_00440 [Sphaerochaetaceae bacterium]|jgi:predicted adenylyl cyclase CyaB|nr:hypothetical protein [Sphaerochaetaceae bacterium]NLY07335.1 hypothetical protein [Spirochaetales bacterium]
MSYEVEIKARIDEQSINELKDKFCSLEGTEILGEVRKNDIYFAVHATDHQLFRVRTQSVGGVKDILITSKPIRSYEGTEINKELEFHARPEELEIIKQFFTSLGYVVCLQKEKNGWSCIVPVSGFNVIVEIFKVNDIGFFLEMEITSIQSAEEDSLISKAQIALHKLLGQVGVSEKAIETTSYRQLILQSMDNESN